MKSGAPLDGVLNPGIRRTRAPKAVVRYRAALIRDLGGEGALTAQQLTIVELIVRTRAFVDQIDDFLLALPTVIKNKKRHTTSPLLHRRTVLVQQLTGLLERLGLDREPPSAEAKSAQLDRAKEELRKLMEEDDDDEHEEGNEDGGAT
jgi:hypothetical protein